MLYHRQKEVAPAADHDNIDMIMSGAVTYEEGLQRPEGSESELRPGVLRFMDIWVTVQHVLQDPVRDDDEGMSGYTGHRNIILDEDIPYALGFGLFANYERSSISMRVSAHLCRISDDKSRVGGESKEIYLHDSVAASDSENSQMKLAEIEHLLSLYALAPAYED